MYYHVKGGVNITKPFNFSTYAMDAVTTLAIALNETLIRSPHLNLSLGDAIKSTVFTGASVSSLKNDSESVNDNNSIVN